MALWHPFMPKEVGKGRERVKIKIIVTLRSHPKRNRKFQRNRKKIKKVRKYHYCFISSQKQVGKGGERDKIKIIVTFKSYPTCNLKFPKYSNKIKKIKIYHYAFINFLNFFTIFLEFSITCRAGTKRNDNSFFLSFSSFSNLFSLEMKP